MKTIVYILPDKDAGVASVVRNLLRYKTNRFRTKVILIHNLLDDENRRIKDTFNADMMIRLEFHGKWSYRQHINNKILKHIDSNSIVVSNDGGIELYSLSQSGFLMPVIYVLHGDFEHYYNVLEHYQNSISKIIAVSSFLKDKVQNVLNKTQLPSKESIKFPVPELNTLKRIRNNAIRLIFVGTLNDRKGVMSFGKIVEILDRKALDYQFSIVGAGDKEKELKTQFAENKRVVLRGKLDNKEVLELYGKQDIIILPSKAEGLPVVLVEAMKCGVVPMATNLKSGIPELIEHGVTGYMLDINDFEGYASYIEKLHNNRSKLDEMSELCIVKSKTMFNPYKQAKKYEDAFMAAKPIQLNKKTRFLDFLPIAIAHKIQSISQ